MRSILIKDTTREERERIVAGSIGNISGACDGCMSGLADMYQAYIDGEKEIREINMEFRAHYFSGDDRYSKTVVCPDGCVMFRLTAKPLGNENFHKGGFWKPE